MANAPPGTTPWHQAAFEGPVTERKDWQSGTATAYIILFLLITFYDQLAKQTLSFGGLGWSLLGTVVAGLLCYGLLYYVPAMWGLRSRQPLSRVTASTFGEAGSRWVPGLVLGLAHVVWYAVTIYLAADVAMRGLVVGRLLDPRYLESDLHWGRWWIQSPLFLFVAFSWALSGAGIGIWFVRLVAAVMKGYAVFPALVLGGAMVWALPGLGGFRPLEIDPVTAELVPAGGPRALVMMVQLVFGFFATSGTSAADWGAYSRSEREVRLGGLVGVAVSIVILAALALLAVAGAQGRPAASPLLEAEREAQERLEQAYAGRARTLELQSAQREVREINGANFTMREVLQHGIGGYAGCVMLLVLGLGMLGPTCYSPFVFGHRFHALWPRVPRWAWSLFGAVLALPLIATGAPERLERVFTVLGAGVAPVIGAMTAEYRRHRGAWPGPRPGWNRAGLFAWLAGLLVGLVPLVGDLAEIPALRLVQPAAVYAFVVALVVYTLLARAGLEPASPTEGHQETIEIQRATDGTAEAQ